MTVEPLALLAVLLAFAAGAAAALIGAPSSRGNEAAGFARLFTGLRP